MASDAAGFDLSFGQTSVRCLTELVKSLAVLWQKKGFTMDEKEQKQRERAYRIWEDEGRPEGADLEHWQRAEDQHEATEKEAAEELAKQAPKTKKAE
jgi:hypothetical protein